MNTGTGSGIAFTSGDHIIDEENYKLSDTAIVYQAELFAIFHACKWIKKHNEIDHKYAIFVDCKGALHSLKKQFSESKTVQIVWDTIEDLKGFNLTFYWIKGHKDNSGNEIADFLAKKGCTDGICIDIPICDAEIKKNIKLFKEKKWQKEWSDCVSTRTKKIVSRVTINKKFRKSLFCSDRTSLRTSVQWATGACCLNDNLFKMGKKSTPLCHFCDNDNETPEHLLLHCDRTEHARLQYYCLNEDNGIIQLNESNNWTWKEDCFNEEKLSFINFIYDNVKFDLFEVEGIS